MATFVGSKLAMPQEMSHLERNLARQQHARVTGVHDAMITQRRPTGFRQGHRAISGILQCAQQRAKAKGEGGGDAWPNF